MNAWLLLKGLETLELRVSRHCSNAVRIADFLAKQKKVRPLLYPEPRQQVHHALASEQTDRGRLAGDLRARRRQAPPSDS
jgi:methionine-gamma-lyase